MLPKDRYGWKADVGAGPMEGRARLAGPTCKEIRQPDAHGPDPAGGAALGVRRGMEGVAPRALPEWYTRSSFAATFPNQRVIRCGRGAIPAASLLLVAVEQRT